MNTKIIKFLLGRNTFMHRAELAFGTDWNQNTKQKRWKYRK